MEGEKNGCVPKPGPKRPAREEPPPGVLPCPELPGAPPKEPPEAPGKNGPPGPVRPKTARPGTSRTQASRRSARESAIRRRAAHRARSPSAAGGNARSGTRPPSIPGGTVPGGKAAISGTAVPGGGALPAVGVRSAESGHTVLRARIGEPLPAELFQRPVGKHVDEPVELFPHPAEGLAERPGNRRSRACRPRAEVREGRRDLSPHEGEHAEHGFPERRENGESRFPEAREQPERRIQRAGKIPREHGGHEIADALELAGEPLPHCLSRRAEAREPVGYERHRAGQRRRKPISSFRSRGPHHIQRTGEGRGRRARDVPEGCAQRVRDASESRNRRFR